VSLRFTLPAIPFPSVAWRHASMAADRFILSLRPAYDRRRITEMGRLLDG
jgi:hypothetical protein